MLKINQSHIQNLYTFTRQHYVEHYDLQTELVDHLANDIESIWQENPKLSFEEARDQSFKKFGVFGFMDVVEQRQKAMNKKYLKYLWVEAKQWFTIPKIIITLTLFLGFYLSFKSAIANYFFWAFYIIMAVWCFIRVVSLNRTFAKRKKLNNKKWLLEEIIFKQAGGTGLVLISQLPTWHNITEDSFVNGYFVVAVSIFTTLFFIWLFISYQLLPDKAEQLLKTTYPEYSL